MRTQQPGAAALTAAQVMARLLITVGPEASVQHAIGLMLKHRLGGLPVVDAQGSLVGMLSEGDLLRRADLGEGAALPPWLAQLRARGSGMDSGKRGALVGDIMSAAAVCVAPGTPLEQVAALMEELGIQRVPVLRDGRLEGMVSRANLLQALLRLVPAAAPAPHGGGEAEAEMADGDGTLSLVEAAALEMDSDIGALGLGLIDTLKLRRSQRAFSPRELPRYRLSRLLWAAFGINRAPERGRTAPSVSNAQEIDIYVATANGWYRYDPDAPALLLCGRADIRAATGKQDYPASAPVTLLYVANLARLPAEDHAERLLHAAFDAGHISQNVYLFCAAEGMATVARGWFDPAGLATLMGLGAGQRVMLAQTVGYPAEAA
jgi:CBS domain-containing protein/nitroreductase